MLFIELLFFAIFLFLLRFNWYKFYYSATLSFYTSWTILCKLKIFLIFNLLFFPYYIILTLVGSDFLQPLINYLYSPQKDQWLPHWSFYCLHVYFYFFLNVLKRNKIKTTGITIGTTKVKIPKTIDIIIKSITSRPTIAATFFHHVFKPNTWTFERS